MPNRLAGQTSPYLLQHARNPVDWWPWGPEAFDEARRRDVPILLSIGYSTCYWCHVMERESFENEEVAAVINREAVPIKLDREERPDVDDLYMAATLIVRGQGGWPMNCFLEPATLKPFFCGTYFPAEARGEMPGFADIVSRVGHAWRTQRERVLGDARTIADAVREQTSADEPPVDLGPGQVSQGVETLLRMADRDRGGFGHAPKFPQPTLIEFLLDVRPRAGDADTAGAIDAVVRRTLDAMACGGVRDQAGGGFHRYAVDHAWLVPHFEKMLYDNAQLAAVYAHAATLYGDPEYARVARETVAYVRRELTEPGGAFCSAQDAEVDHREGLNYLWTPEQVRAAMPPDDAEWAIKVYGLDQGPNFQDPHHPHDSPANVLRLAARPERLAGDQRLTREAFVERLRRVNAALYEARLKRKQPLLDDKVIASWNGMMIAAMARVGQVLDDPDTVDAAERAADRVLALLTSPEGPRRVARAGVPGHAAALLEDHAALASGLAQVARARPARRDLLDRAAALVSAALDAFRVGGRFFDTPGDAPDLFVRASAIHDGATPSAVSSMLHALIDLAELTERREFLDAAIDGLRAHSARIAATPAGAINSVRALFRLLVWRPDAKARLAPQGGGATAPQPQRQESFTPVEVWADVDRVRVAPDVPGVLHLAVHVAPGHHVVAAEPGPGGGSLVPFRVGIAGGGGVEAFADYPPGSPPTSHEGGPLCYEGRFELVVALDRRGEWTGRPMLVATFQACTDTECLAPTTIELDVAIDQA